MPQVGLLGGSFDPVHRAHIALALAARDALGLEHVELLPAARPWQRGRLGAAPEHRLRMLELACADIPGLRVNPIELQRAGNTYTIDTLSALPDTARYTWILGSDQLANFCTWHRWRDLLQHVRLAVAERPGAPATPPPELADALTPGGLVQIPFSPQPVSATAIRQALAAGRPTESLLDPRVLDYIRTHRLYLDPKTP
ncbi:MAG: nicotinate (nicotinamide) nucleotide adenylyltransferase [Castellaniella sp.]|uniref:nicotinate (nicotinamide) nucleotide adenylyltransferase n=1 Tax=Castellaniella sp. TaxID=1955812 RepID=UPI002A371C48|nr:nicotinate (nicotinamide) nucleotide adenylyltransferase [Castellaniella sp.]MDY0309457.1 nicotinate (nicotinamide) nucleotide adenylyltransferase [Castellaniella sp.]